MVTWKPFLNLGEENLSLIFLSKERTKQLAGNRLEPPQTPVSIGSPFKSSTHNTVALLRKREAKLSHFLGHRAPSNKEVTTVHHDPNITMIFNFHATFRSANSNPSCTSTAWMPWNVTMTQRTYDPGKQSVRHVTLHVTCLSVSVVVFNCLMLV